METKDLVEVIKKEEREENERKAKEVIKNQMHKISLLEDEIETLTEEHKEEKELFNHMLKIPIKELAKKYGPTDISSQR